MIEVPTIIINFKTYNQASGIDAVKLTKDCADISKKTKKSIIVCAQAPDINACSKNKLPVFAQHVDVFEAGGHTGKINIKSLKENGAMGCLVNHSENRISFKQIMQTVALLAEAEMVSVVCVKNAREAKRVAKLNPDIIAIEPPKLIGGDVSVTRANPNIVKKSVEAVKSVSDKIPVLCGAGVKNSDDVKKAIELGAMGVLVASGVTKADNQKSAILELTKGI
ncbi:triose-phosphate isomerase [Candidatus Woesearchaeota archaeon]|nr:triose-phosphate isomerase [Candidatus Woesearchaeota archaeon]